MSVILPFFGDVTDASRMVAALTGIERRPGDELIVVDNTGAAVVAGIPHECVDVIEASEARSSYYARNVGAERAVNEWLLFIDADCRPSAGLLDAYFLEPVDDACGALAGEVEGARDQDGTIPRYARSRRHLRQADPDHRHPYKPMAVTANLLVRRAAWEALGGFYEGIRSAGDSDFSWRLQEAGWGLGYRREAAVEHRHRERFLAMVRQAARYGSGRGWVRRRRPDYPRPRVARELARSIVGVVAWTLLGRFERAAFKGLDGIWVAAESAGSLLSNVAAPPAVESAGVERRGVRIVVAVDSFPALSETFVLNEVRALMRAGHEVRVEAPQRPQLPLRGGARGLRVAYYEDDGLLRKLTDLFWLVGHHPLRSLRDLVCRLRWRKQEPPRPLRAIAPAARRLSRGGEQHIHVHFAAGAALDALRLSMLMDVTFSVTAHAYDIFQHPRNLAEKMERASFVTTGCEYNASYLRETVPRCADRVHKVVMGIDGASFRRRRPYPGGGMVLAVGRLVEKKGFRHLVDATALMGCRGPLERVVIVGEGPLRGQLESQIERLGLSTRVALAGPRDPSAVRGLLEQAALLVMPCVVAGDGDRDSMPVVVKEALSMEVPVVATREVGLPEVVDSKWGRLVEPGDAAALARGMGELLSQPQGQLAAMGRAGREWVLQHADVDSEAGKLAELIAQGLSMNLRFR